MKINWKIIIPVVVILVLAVYMVINMNDRGDIRYKLPKLEKVVQKDVERIEYASSARTLTLVKDKEIWRSSPENYPITQSVVDSMLEQIVELSLSELISEQKIYDKYDLDQSNRITVKVSAKGRVVRNLDIGKVSDIGHTFVKLDSDPDVYSVKENLRTQFEKTLTDIRDKTVLNIDKDSVRQITINNGGQEIVLNKVVTPAVDNEPSKTEWRIPGQEKPALQKEVDEILNSVTSLVCDSYIPEDQKFDFSKPEFSITFVGDKTYSLKSLERLQDNMYPAMSSENDYPVYLIGWKMNRLMKGITDFMEE